MNAKLRAAQLQKVPYMLVVGDREAAANVVALRDRSGRRQDDLPLADFTAYVSQQVADRALAL